MNLIPIIIRYYHQNLEDNSQRFLLTVSPELMGFDTRTSKLVYITKFARGSLHEMR